MADDGIREIHGATPMAGTSKDPHTVREEEGAISVYYGSIERLRLTPASARFFARKLYRLARRIEQRQAA